MVKSIVSHSIDRKLLNQVEECRRELAKVYEDISRSATIEILLREALASRRARELAVAT